mgnify:CR=1 FL=1
MIVGVGYVGFEFAQAFRRFGSRVTVLQRGPQLLPREDQDVADAIRSMFEEQGIEVLLGADTRSVQGRSGERITLKVATAGGERSIDGSHLLIAVGRTPNTRGIGLETAGIALDERGYIQVDEQLQTSVPKVWAGGACIVSGTDLTVQSVQDGKLAAHAIDRAIDRALGGNGVHVG